jgi:hypothetical protein
MLGGIVNQIKLSEKDMQDLEEILYRLIKANCEWTECPSLTTKLLIDFTSAIESLSKFVNEKRCYGILDIVLWDYRYIRLSISPLCWRISIVEVDEVSLYSLQTASKENFHITVMDRNGMGEYMRLTFLEDENFYDVFGCVLETLIRYVELLLVYNV